MGPTLQRYFLLQMLGPFLVGVAAFTAILLIIKILKLVELVVSRGVPLLKMLALFSYVMPAFLEVALPMALLLAVILAFARLSADSEITALKSSGISLYQMLTPVGIVASVVFVLTLVCSVHLRAWGNYQVKRELYEITKIRATAGLKERVFNDDFDDYVIYVQNIEPLSNTLHGILIADLQKNETVVAREGVLITSEARHTLTLRLKDGALHSFTPGKRPYEHKDYQNTKFAQADYTLNLKKLASAFDRSSAGEKDPKEMPFGELRRAIAAGQSPTGLAAEQRIEFHRRLAVPFACLVFALLGVPLGVQPARSVRARSFATSLAVIFFYYLLLSTGETLGARNVTRPATGVWLPNVVFGLLGVLLFLRQAQEVEFRIPLGIVQRLEKKGLIWFLPAKPEP